MDVFKDVGLHATLSVARNLNRQCLAADRCCALLARCRSKGEAMTMAYKHLIAGALFGVLSISMANAQGVPGGIERGAATGDRAAGPVGAVVGGAVGGVVGGVGGLLGVEQRPRFREYVVTQKRPSYTYREDLREGAVLPEQGVTYYDVPPEYGATNYRYTVVNNRTVLVDPRTHAVVQVIE
jgi:hypothetical protein